MAQVAQLTARMLRTEMWPEPAVTGLTASQAACMMALRGGAASKMQIALAAGFTLRRTQRALAGLATLGLARRSARHRWGPTRSGRTCQFSAAPERKRRADAMLGAASLRALRALDRPMSESELAARLAVTRQRAHQLLVKLHAAGCVRLGDGEHGFRIVARVDDPTPLLSRQEQRVLSAMPGHYATTAAKIVVAIKCSKRAVAAPLKRLLGLGLITCEDTAAGSQIYRLTATGAAHPQHRRVGGRADPPKLPVRSNRVCAVLALLADRGHAQLAEVSDALDAAYQSINALFQYLKRKELVRRQGKGAGTPYVLTAHGQEVLAEMQRRRAT